MARKKKRIAAIDVGTNSIHMIIVEPHRHGYRVLDREKQTVQLGRGSLGGEPLRADAMSRAIAALRRMCEIAKRWEVDSIHAVATSAVREAPNRRAFVRQVEREAGINVRVISGDEEADYIYRGVRAAVDLQGSTAFCIDIGGGSVELIVGTDSEVYFTRSEPLGALRLTERYFRSDPPAGQELRAAREHVRRSLRKPLGAVRALGFDLCIGSSGTIVTLADLASGRAGENAVTSGLKPLERGKLEEWIVRLSSVSADERTVRFGLDPKRSETIVAGAIVLNEIMRELSIDELIASNAALREGIVERALSEFRADRSGGVRGLSVRELASRSGVDRAHATHVAQLALRIFDQTRGLHALRQTDRELLEAAALLHEIGMHVSYEGYHKHTYYLIRHAGLRGFTEDQIAVVANVARYHRKSPPNSEHANFSELRPAQRATVQKLAAILRMADALDRGRHQVVRDVGIDATKSGILFKVRPRHDPAIEIESAAKRVKYFQQTFDRTVRLQVEGS